MNAVYLCLFQWAVPLLCLRLTVHRRNRWIITTLCTWRLYLNFSTDTKPAVDWPTRTCCASFRNVGRHKVIETAAGFILWYRNIRISVLFSCERFSFLVPQNDAQSTKWTKWINAVWDLNQNDALFLWSCICATKKKNFIQEERFYHLYHSDGNLKHVSAHNENMYKEYFWEVWKYNFQLIIILI